MKLSGKVAWITGGTRMGQTVAQALGEKGCRIVLSWRHSKKAAEETLNQLHDQGIDAMAIQSDILQVSSFAKSVRQIEQRFGRLDILVNLASIYEQTQVSNTVDLKRWNALMAVHAQGAYALSAAVAPLMRRTGNGRIIHFSDWTGASGRPRYKTYSAYYVSKAAVKSVVEALALELAPTILVNAIAPGPILAPKGLTGRQERAVRQATPLGRWGGPEEIAKAVLFLVETDFVTGETIRVDGGRHLY